MGKNIFRLVTKSYTVSITYVLMSTQVVYVYIYEHTPPLRLRV